MSDVAVVALALCVAFLLGSIPSALLMSRRLGVDLRQLGSGNPGATNVYRALGPRAGLIVLAADMAKGLAAVLVARIAGVTPAWLLGAAGAAVLGHMVSPFMGFRGGKGVATGGGAVLGLTPVIGVLIIAVFAIVLALTRLVSLGSICAAVALPILVWFFEPPIPGFMIVALVISTLIVARHRANIVRLMRGEENAFQVKGGGDRS